VAELISIQQIQLIRFSIVSHFFRFSSFSYSVLVCSFIQPFPFSRFSRISHSIQQNQSFAFCRIWHSLPADSDSDSDSDSAIHSHSAALSCPIQQLQIQFFSYSAADSAISIQQFSVIQFYLADSVVSFSRFRHSIPQIHSFLVRSFIQPFLFSSQRHSVQFSRISSFYSLDSAIPAALAIPTDQEIQLSLQSFGFIQQIQRFQGSSFI
jgi:hypothetical protein